MRPESLHTPILLVHRQHLLLSLVDHSNAPFEFKQVPQAQSPTGADVWMAMLLDKVDFQKQRSSGGVSAPRVEDTMTMSAIRRGLRHMAKRELTSNTVKKISELKQSWKLLSNRSLKLRRKNVQQQMWDIQGRKGYWNFINEIRKRQRGIPLAAKHIEKHFQRLLYDPTSAREAVYVKDPLPKLVGLPPCQPAPGPMDKVRLEDKMEDILGEIDMKDLLTTPISALEVSYALGKMPNSAIGEDRVQINELKTIPSLAIAQFFSDLVDDMVVPSCWNRAVLVPIPKKGVPSDAAQLRGIAIQPALRRLFMACMAQRLYRWCQSEHVLPPMQSGFCPSYRTTENIFVLRCLVERSRADNTTLIATSVDIEKAFDRVTRPILWAKLSFLGASGPLLELVKHMYADPHMTIQFNRRYSKFLACSKGVMQGCPLSPLLFIIYILDLPVTSWFDPQLNGQRISALMLADDVLLLATSVIGMENKLQMLQRYLKAHHLKLNASKCWSMNLGVGRGVDPEVAVSPGVFIPHAEKELYNGWMLEAKVGGRPWQIKRHLDHCYNGSNSVAQSLMSLNKQLHLPTAAMAVGMYRALVEPELIYACESSFDTTDRQERLYGLLQAKYLKFCLGLPFGASSEVTLWDCGQMHVISRRIQLTARFYSHLSTVHEGRISYHAIRDSVQLSQRRKGWFFEWCRRCPGRVPSIDEDCSAFASDVDLALRGIQWEQVMSVIFWNANLRSLQWSPPRRTLQKAAYLYMVKHDARAIARLRMGMNGLAVHRMAWEGTLWEDRKCVFCNAVETETHVMSECGVFYMERRSFFADIASVRDDCGDWSTKEFMSLLVCPGRVEAPVVALFVWSVWKEIDERVAGSL